MIPAGYIKRSGVTFAISGTDADSFSIDPNTGEVNILASPDAEAKNSYQFEITATDAAGNSSNPQTVLLGINNLDDTAPTITSPTNVSVDENIPAGQVIYTATADDSADVSSGVTFAISGTDAGSFSIDPNTGEVNILASPDAEIKNSYQFDITATDAAGNSSNPQTVLLGINNLDDTAPTITSPTNVSVDENIPAGQVIYTATADDSTDVSSGVTFAISGTDAGSFSIDPNTGEVNILASPDAEIKNSYQFDIIATDAAGNSSNPQTVLLGINNLDDTAPTITSDRQPTSPLMKTSLPVKSFILRPPMIPRMYQSRPVKSFILRPPMIPRMYQAELRLRFRDPMRQFQHRPKHWRSDHSCITRCRNKKFLPV